MSRLGFPILVAATLIATLGIGWGIGRWRRSEATTNSPTTASGDRGALIYQMNCATCHGPEGHGDGSSAASLKPAPRDFAVRPWRFSPTLESIRKITHDGIPGTAMPGFHTSLTPQEQEAVAKHVLRLATDQPPRPANGDGPLFTAAGFVDLRGTSLPSLTLHDAQGSKKGLGDFLGTSVLLHFWGTECLHCIQEMPALTDLEKRYAGRLRVVHVCTDVEEAKKAQEILDRRAPGVRTYVDETGVGVIRYEIQALPTVWLIDAQGQAVARRTGSADWTTERSQTLIERFLPESAK